MTLAERYFLTQVAGQAEGTTDAKQRDLACFLHFYMQLYGHDDARQWYKSVTEAFLKKPRPRQGAQVANRRVHYRNVAADDAHLPPPPAA
jgi:hypothetical protein